MFLSDFPPAASLGFITGATDNHSPETLLAVPDTFPAGVIVGDAPSFIEKKGQFLFPFLAHSRHRHSSFLPSCQYLVQDSEIWSRFGIIFCIFCPLRQAFLTSNIFTWGLSCLTAENAVWSCFGIILEQFIWTTLTTPIIPFKIPCHLQHLFPECEQFRDAVTDFILHSQRAFSARIEVPCDLIQVHTDLSICPHQTSQFFHIGDHFYSMHDLLFHQKFPQAFGSGHPQNLRLPVQKFQLNIRKPDSDKTRMVQFLFHSPFSHDFISFLSVTSVTPQRGEPAVLPESSFCAASHFPVDANICQIGRSSRVWGIEIPGKSPTQENTIVYYWVDLALGKSPSRAQPVS